MEATGNYSKPIVSFFQQANYQVIVLNPLETHQQKKAAVLSAPREKLLAVLKTSRRSDSWCDMKVDQLVLAATILGEIGDISRFPTSKQIVAFAGLDPSVFESGKFKSTNNRISKRGSSYIRKALYQATVVGISKRTTGILNPVLYEYYSKKLSEGKPSKVAIVATSSKLLRIIYGIWNSQQPFTV